MMSDKRSEREKEKTALAQDKSIQAIKLLIEEISKNNSVSFEEIISAIKNENDDEHSQTKEADTKQKKHIDDETKTSETKREDEETKNSIPITLFQNNAGYLELLTFYLKDNLGLSLSKIAKTLNRDQRTIWSSYNNAKEKVPKLKIEKTTTLIPINVFSNRELSPLSNLVVFLSDKKSIKEIAHLLKKDYRTIWTAHNRTKVRRKEK